MQNGADEVSHDTQLLLLLRLADYQPTIPDELTRHWLTRVDLEYFPSNNNVHMRRMVCT